MDVYVLTWTSSDIDDRFEIHAFGKTKDGQSAVCRVVTKPYFYVKLGSMSLARRRMFLDDVTQKYRVMEHLSSMVQKKDAWGYSTMQDNYAKLVFPTMRDLKRAKKDMARDYQIYEGNVDPVVRICHDRQIDTVGWITINPRQKGQLYGSADIEWIVSAADISASSETSIPPLIICSWDIEVYSHDGSFPKSSHPDNCIIQIASAFQKLGEPEPYLTTVVSLNDTADVEGVDIRSVDDEIGVVLEWIDLLQENSVDIFLAYNSWQFDWEYIIGRQNVFEELLGDADVAKAFRTLGRGGPGAGQERTWELNSGAYGQNTYSLIRAPGILDLDLMQLVKRDHKLDSYSLNNVASKFLGETKIDLPAYQIFEKFTQGPDERAEIARYAAKDVLLPLQLLTKLNVFENLTQMAIATGVPVEYLLSRGQQIKVYSVILKQAKEMGYLLPDDKSMSITGKFEGATVLDAKKGVYYDPVCGLDFASLYPSIMRSFNLCYSTLILPGTEEPENVYTIDTGLGVYKFAQDDKGILPTLLENLATWRKAAKKKMAACKASGDTFGESLWNGAQLAFKVTMNSVYGFTGASRGFMPCVPIAAATTATGRRLIDETKRLCLEMVPGSDVVYGDSVAPYTPIHIRVNGVYELTTFELLAARLEWTQRSDGKEYASPTGIETWSDKGWTPVLHVIRHVHTDPLVRVCTHTGIVDVTRDHSLLRPDGERVRPSDVKVDELLMHAPLPNMETGSMGLDDDGAQRDQNTQLSYAALYSVYMSQGFSVSISSMPDNTFKVTASRQKVSNPHTIRKMFEVPSTGLVYDFSTENHHFSAGIGQLVVHNTDSVMVRFKVPEEHTLDLEYHFKIAEDVAARITEHFPGCVELEFEKVYYPYMLFSKKRYAGLMFTDPSKPDYIDVKGIQIVRRDNAPIVKTVSQSILDAIMYDKSTDKAIDKARECVLRVLRGKEPIDSFVVSKTLRGSYANPNAQPHVQVARKIQERTGKVIQSGVRVPYVFVVDNNIDQLISQRAEDPEYVVEHEVPIDYILYIDNQLTSPINALLELLVTNPMLQILGHPDIAPLLSTLRAERNERITTTKRVKLNQKNRQREITQFFKK